MNFDPSAGQVHCRIVCATPEDVPQAYDDLNRDMDPEFVHVFLDKIQRYAIKPDRDLYLAQYHGTTIAFATIIDESPVPEESKKETAALLKDYACGTGLMVLPEYRNQGVASQLVKSWQQWAIARNRAGVWIVTRQMAQWYQRCFHFSVVGTTLRHRVKKTLLAKAL
jgi:GNAT superfamily N-acetyltransferase